MWRYFLLVVALQWPTAVAAEPPCDCSQKVAQLPLIRANFEFWGEAVNRDQYERVDRVEFRVLEHFQGEEESRVVVYVAEPCALDLIPGQTYFVRAHTRKQRRQSGYYTNSCARTRPLARPPGPVEMENEDARPIEHALDRRLDALAAEAAERCSHEAGDGVEYDAFLGSLVPDDDPFLQELEPYPSAAKPRSSCVADFAVQTLVELDVDEPIVVSAGARYEPAVAGLADVWACDAPHPCRSFSETMREKLLDVAAPMTTEQARLLAGQMHHVTDRDPSIEIARTLCRLDGLDAAEAFAQNNKLVGGKRWETEFRAMMFECSVALRDYERARELLKTAAPGVAFEVALDWVAAHGAEKLPVRKADFTLPASTDLPLVVVRQAFARTDHWTNEAIWLEAFAESVAADPAAPAAVRRVGALAYHKAAHLYPDGAERYRAYARELAADDELAADLARLAENFDRSRGAHAAGAALAARAAAASDDAPAVDVEPEPPATEGDDDGVKPRESSPDWGSLALHMLVIVGSLSFVAFIANRGTRRRRR